MTPTQGCRAQCYITGQFRRQREAGPTINTVDGTVVGRFTKPTARMVDRGGCAGRGRPLKASLGRAGDCRRASICCARSRRDRKAIRRCPQGRGTDTAKPGVDSRAISTYARRGEFRVFATCCAPRHGVSIWHARRQGRGKLRVRSRSAWRRGSHPWIRRLPASHLEARPGACLGTPIVRTSAEDALPPPRARQRYARGRRPAGVTKLCTASIGRIPRAIHHHDPASVNRNHASPEKRPTGAADPLNAFATT